MVKAELVKVIRAAGGVLIFFFCLACLIFTTTSYLAYDSLSLFYLLNLMEITLLSIAIVVINGTYKSLVTSISTILLLFSLIYLALSIPLFLPIITPFSSTLIAIILLVFSALMIRRVERALGSIFILTGLIFGLLWWVLSLHTLS